MSVINGNYVPDASPPNPAAEGEGVEPPLPVWDPYPQYATDQELIEAISEVEGDWLTQAQGDSRYVQLTAGALTDERVPLDNTVTPAKLTTDTVALFDPAGSAVAAQNYADAKDAAHLGQADPHDQYLTQGEGDAAYITLTELGVPGGVASLGSDGKINPAQIPAIPSGNTFVVSSQAQMLALAATRGDVAYRTELSPEESFRLAADDPTVLANWIQITTPGAVVSVDGQSGAVDLSTTYATIATANGKQPIPTVSTQTANYTALPWEIVKANAVGGAFSVTAPAAPSVGTQFWVEKSDSSANAVTLIGTFDGLTNPQLARQFDSFWAVWDGSGWTRPGRVSVTQLTDYPATTDLRYATITAVNNRALPLGSWTPLTHYVVNSVIKPPTSSGFTGAWRCIVDHTSDTVFTGGASGYWERWGAETFADLTDANVAGPVDGDALLYNATANEWRNGAQATPAGEVTPLSINESGTPSAMSITPTTAAAAVRITGVQVIIPANQTRPVYLSAEVPMMRDTGTAGGAVVLIVVETTAQAYLTAAGKTLLHFQSSTPLPTTQSGLFTARRLMCRIDPTDTTGIDRSWGLGYYTTGPFSGVGCQATNPVPVNSAHSGSVLAAMRL